MLDFFLHVVHDVCVHCGYRYNLLLGEREHSCGFFLNKYRTGINTSPSVALSKWADGEKHASKSIFSFLYEFSAV